MALEKFMYDNKIARNFMIATLVWGIVSFLVGLIAALLLLYPQLSFGLAEISFGRLRPLHTNAAIFAFVGNSIFAAVYYSMPRLLKTPMYSKVLSNINFWGWQLIILLAAVSLLAGITTSKEYAELEWPIDILIAVVWVIFGLNMIMTLTIRRTKHIYVSIWFYIATFVTVAVLHIVNSIELPVSFIKSYPIYAGAQDAVVQWWYGHNAVAFFLTTPILGLMYYYLPKAANRPIYSYKLSVIHFWSLIFLYIWTGPHHLLYQALPDWLQALGVVFSIALIAPSWGGMINGLLTLRGAWDKVRQDPVLKMFVVGITAYGMSTLEGPLLALKSINAITHFTDWTIAHVHIATLGWNGMLAFGMLYWMFPKIFKVKLYSKPMANAHFWLATFGMLLFAIPLYFAGLTQALMWKEFTTDGFLKYSEFLDTYLQIRPMYFIRVIGGVFYMGGAILMVINLIKTAKSGTFLRYETDEAVPFERKTKKEGFHRRIEGKPVVFTLLVFIAIIIGGIVEFVPMFVVRPNVPSISSVEPYTPLELQGRDIYVKEGCYNCHSQMIRPFRSEVARYGEYSKAGEFVYNHPFQWGSKRTGPDLAREGLKYGNDWQYNHMINPQAFFEKSIMPPYPWLARRTLDIASTPKKIRVMQTLGVPYEEGYDKRAIADLEKQAKEIVAELKSKGIDARYDEQLIALVAYMQRLGTDIGKEKLISK